MSFVSNLIKARSNLAFVTGLCMAASVALAVEKRGDLASLLASSGAVITPPEDMLDLAPRTELTAADAEAARIAWAYFQANTQESGMVNSVNGYPSTTMWAT